VESNLNDNTLECRSVSPSSDSTPILVTSKSKISLLYLEILNINIEVLTNSCIALLTGKKKSTHFDKYDEALIEALNKNNEPSPIDGFVLRLAEGLRRLSYRQRLKLEIEILTKLRN